MGPRYVTNQRVSFVNMRIVWHPLTKSVSTCSGQGPKALPENIGIPLFDPNGTFRSIVLEIHYNNPENLEGLVDTSGFRIYYTTKPRPMEAAWMVMGDPSTLLEGQPIGDGLTKYSFSCASDCSATILGSEYVTVIDETLHMHKRGVRMTNELIRNGEVANLGAADVFEFKQQGSFQVQQDLYKILPGDSFRTTCYYRDGTKFGFSSEEEMCLAAVLYYPAKRLDFGFLGSFPWACMYGMDFMPICKEELENQTLAGVEDLGRRFGTPSQCMTSPTDDMPSNDTATTSTGSEEQTDSAHRMNVFVILNLLLVVGAVLSL
jgi:hypothetical protein